MVRRSASRKAALIVGTSSDRTVKCAMSGVVGHDELVEGA
jgi:hypothetical protein